MDLKKFIGWAGENFDLPILEEFLRATPTAELEPITATYVQSDEADMGVTYAELGTFGVRIFFSCKATHCANANLRSVPEKDL